MASALSQALTIEQFVCGMPQRERQWQAHLLDTWIRSILWHSRQMARTSSQVHVIERFVCGTSQFGEQRQAHLPDTWIQSSLWHSPQMVSVSSHQNTDQFAS